MLADLLRTVNCRELTSWSARAVLVDIDWRMRCLFPLVRVGDVRRRPDVSSEFISKLRSLPVFERYRYARTGGINDIKAELSLLCPVPPCSVQKELLDNAHSTARENMKLFQSAQDELRVGLGMIESALGIRIGERQMYGPFARGSEEELPSWSARVSCSVRPWVCKTSQQNLGKVLSAPINKIRRGVLGPSRERGSTAVVCLKVADVGQGVLKNVPQLVEPHISLAQGEQEVPTGCIILCLRHQGYLRFWLNDGSLHAPVVVGLRDFAVLDPDEDLIDSHFLRLVLRLDFVYDQVQRLSTGANVRRIGLSRLPFVSLPCPDIGAQREILRLAEPYFMSSEDTLARIDENKRRSVRQWERSLFREN